MHTQRRIIIAMPNRPLFDVLNYNLTKRHYTVLHAHCGMALVAALAAGAGADLIIASRNLGDMTAFAALTLLRAQQPGAAQIPVLVVTPALDDETVGATAKLGIAGYVTEAFDLEDLIARIEGQIGASQVVESITLSGVKIISCRGSISAHHARQLRDAINTLAETTGCRMVVDLTETEFLAHQALVVLLSAHDKLKACGGTLAICGANPGISTMFSSAAIDSTIRICASRAQALQEI